MKKITLIVVCLFVSSFGYAQSAVWQWSERAGGTWSEYANRLTTDANGNIYITGDFGSDTLIFGSDTLFAPGGFFIAKYDASGNALWARRAGGIGAQAGRGISTDVNGNIYVGGYFRGSSITFGSFILNNSIGACPNGCADIFVVKYDSTGNVLWARKAGAPDHDYGQNISVDANGNVFVTGYFYSNSIIFGIDTITNAGAWDAFVAKYDSSGNELWARSAGGTNEDRSMGISTDISGNVFITGYFVSPSMNFGSTTLTNNGIFIAKYNASGNLLWARGAGGTANDFGIAVSTDVNGNTYLTGRFGSSSITFGPSTLTTNGYYLAKYDSSGNAIWGRCANESGINDGNGIATDASGNVVVTGSFSTPTITFGNISLINAGGQNVFVVKYDTAGNVLWATNASGIGYDEGWGIAVDVGGNTIISGEFSSPSLTIGSNTLVNAATNGSSDIFVAKLDYTTRIVENNNSLSAINLFPNPASSEIIVESGKFNVERIEMYNVVGERVKEIYLTSNPSPSGEGSASIDVSELIPGIYFVAVTDEAGNRVVRKVVKM